MTVHNASEYSRYNNRYQGAPRHTSRRGFIAGGIVVGCVAAVGVATPALASGVIDDLKTRAGTLTGVYQEVVDAYKSADFVAGRQAAHQAASEIAAFSKEISGPLWTAAQAVPVYGTDVKAARQLVAMLDDLTADVLVPVSDVLVNVSAGSLVWKNPDDSVQLNLEVVQQLVDILTDAMPTIDDAVELIAGLPTLHIEQLKSVVERAQDLVVPLQGKLGKLTDLLALVPDLLGADGQQHEYLIVAQNNVEIRSTGGFTGAWIPLYVSNGAIYMGDVYNVGEYLPSNDSYRVYATDEEYALFGDSVAWVPGNVGADPDFPRVASIWSELALAQRGEVINGILAVDPVFFQSVIGLTNGAVMSDGTTIDGTNAATVLMHDTYWKYMDYPTLMDEFFADAVSVAVDALMNSIQDIDVSRLMTVVNDAIDERHLLLWFADSAAEEVLEEIGCTGSLSHDETKPIFGVYMYNVTWSKIEWWLNSDVQVGAETVNADGSRSYPVTVTFTNIMTYDELYATGGNQYILGEHTDIKLSDDDIVDQIYLYAPAGGYIADDSYSGTMLYWQDATHDGLQVKTGQIHARIDEPVQIQCTVTTSPLAKEALTVSKTPTLEELR